jgi:SsrA-binding protein
LVKCKVEILTDWPQISRMSIVDNRKAFHDYFIEERYEAGIALEGWEVKSIRAGRVQLKEAYVIVRDGEVFLFGAHISALQSASSHVHPEAIRTRKLLLHAEEIKRLIGKVDRSGYTLVPLNLHFKGGRVKCEIGLAKGKKQHDKRDTERERDAQREVEKAMKTNRR